MAALLESTLVFLLVLSASSLCSRATDTETSIVEPECAKTLDAINNAIESAFSAIGEFNMSINCMSFDEEAALEMAIASGFPVNMTEDPVRYQFICNNGVIVALSSNHDASTQEYGICVRCVDEADPCSESCDAECERCIDTPSTCTRCAALRDDGNCHPSCGPDMEGDPQRPIPENNNTCGPCECLFGDVEDPSNNCFCNCTTGFTGDTCSVCSTGYINLDEYPHGEEEIEIDEVEEVPHLGDATCDSECRVEDYEPSTPNGDIVPSICFACGIEYCIECEHGTDYCDECLSETVHFEGKCYAGLMAKIALVAEEQEREVEEEEEARRMASLLLATLLPISCVLVIIFFVGMSVYAHHRYPHVSTHGEKRHKTETVQPTQHERVFRPRPTIILR